ncbi:MAG: DUF2306 domain-containing protein [Burkholderiales bacterium]|nr:DUF2306 domain-containing protein [Burkholderiales bacterium]
MPWKMSRVEWGSVLLLSMSLGIVMWQVELPLLMHQHPDWDTKIEPYRYALHVHAFFGMMALLVAPFQFISEFRQHSPRLHRYLGRTYVASILISAPIAIYIASTHLQNEERLAVIAQALLWMSTTCFALYYAIKRHWTAHKIWIARSYALCLSFVLSRLATDVLHYSFSPQSGGNAAMVWLMSLLLICLADVWSCQIQHRTN